MFYNIREISYLKICFPIWKLKRFLKKENWNRNHKIYVNKNTKKMRVRNESEYFVCW